VEGKISLCNRLGSSRGPKPPGKKKERPKRNKDAEIGQTDKWVKGRSGGGGKKKKKKQRVVSEGEAK